MFNKILRNGRIVDGSGNPWFKADIGIREGKIAAIGDLRRVEAGQIIDAIGNVITPGFVDIHAHSDLQVLVNPNAESKIRQGVTLEVNGNCGTSAAPLQGFALERTNSRAEKYGLDIDWKTMGEYLDRLEKQGLSLNCISFVGHGTVRQCVLGN
ncbi:MAG: amidohydrolase family protein, partial [Dehalococcoidia bacterium]